MSDQKRFFLFFGGLAFCLLVAVVSVQQLSEENSWIGITVAAVLSLFNLAAINKLSPPDNVGGKIIVGMVAGTVTVLALCWFMTGPWFAVYFLAGLVVYATASSADMK